MRVKVFPPSLLINAECLGEFRYATSLINALPQNKIDDRGKEKIMEMVMTRWKDSPLLFSLLYLCSLHRVLGEELMPNLKRMS